MSFASWEAGEWIAWLLWPVTALLPKWLICGCEARRKWCNEQGEKIWQWLNPSGHSRFLSRFQGVVLQTLDSRITPAKTLHATLMRNGVKVSERTMARWLGQLPVRTVTKNGEVLYGMPTKRLTSSQ